MTQEEAEAMRPATCRGRTWVRPDEEHQGLKWGPSEFYARLILQAVSGQMEIKQSTGSSRPILTWTSGERKQFLTSDYVVIICPGVVGIMRLRIVGTVKQIPVDVLL